MSVAGGYILYFVTSLLAIFVSLYIISCIKKSSGRSCFSWVMIQFHISLIGSVIFTLPIVYEGSGLWCKIVPFFCYYFALSNVLSMLCLVSAYSVSILNVQAFKFASFVRKYGLLIIYGIPLTSVLMYPARELKGLNEIWCIVLRGSWFIDFYIVLTELILFVAIAVVIFTAIKLYWVSRSAAVAKVSSTAGLYALISIASWLFRLFFDSQTGGNVILLGFFGIPMSALLYFLVFILFEKKIVHLFESTASDRLISTDIEYTWEANEILEEIIKDSDRSISSASISTRQSSLNMATFNI